MSITFWVPEAPTKDIPCEYCAWERETCGEDAKCSPICSGTQNVSEGPSCNFSNMNALMVLELMGIEPDYCGGLDLDALHAVQQKLLVTMNKQSARSWTVMRPTDEGGEGTGTARMIYQGNTDEQTVRRLVAVQNVITWAQKNGLGISWG